MILRPLNTHAEVPCRALKWFSRLRENKALIHSYRWAPRFNLSVYVCGGERRRKLEPRFTAYAKDTLTFPFKRDPLHFHLSYARSRPAYTTCWCRKMTREKAMARRCRRLRGLKLRRNVGFIISIRRTCRLQQMLVGADLFCAELGQTHAHVTGYTWPQVPCSLFWAQQCNVLNTGYTSHEKQLHFDNVIVSNQQAILTSFI